MGYSTSVLDLCCCGLGGLLLLMFLLVPQLKPAMDEGGVQPSTLIQCRFPIFHKNGTKNPFVYFTSVGIQEVKVACSNGLEINFSPDSSGDPADFNSWLYRIEDQMSFTDELELSNEGVCTLTISKNDASQDIFGELMVSVDISFPDEDSMKNLEVTVYVGLVVKPSIYRSDDNRNMIEDIFNHKPLLKNEVTNETSAIAFCIVDPTKGMFLHPISRNSFYVTRINYSCGINLFATQATFDSDIHEPVFILKEFPTRENVFNFFELCRQPLFPESNSCRKIFEHDGEAIKAKMLSTSLPSDPSDCLFLLPHGIAFRIKPQSEKNALAIKDSCFAPAYSMVPELQP